MADTKGGDDSPVEMSEKKEKQTRRESVFDDEARRRQSVMDLTNNVGGE